MSPAPNAADDRPAHGLTVDELATRLRNAQRNGALVLSGETLQAQEVDDLLSAIGLSQLELDQPGISSTAGVISVAGKWTVFEPITVDAKATFVVEDGVLSTALHAGFPDDAQLPLLGLSWASVGNLALDLSVAGPSLPVPVVSGAMSGAIKLHGVQDPIEVSLGPSIGPGDWLLRATDIPLPNPVAILTVLLEGHDASALTPPKLDLAGFRIVELSCGFEPSDLTVHSLAVTVGAPEKKWKFAPGLPELSDVNLNLGLEFAGKQTSVAFGAGATITLPHVAALPVQVTREADQWKVAIIGAHDFPSLGQLVKAVAPDAADFLPDVLGTLEMESATLELALGSGDPALRSVFFSTRLKKKWTLIARHLWLERVALELFVDRVGAHTTGFFTGTIALDGVEVPVALRKPAASAPLTLELGTAAPPSVSGVSSLSGVAGGSDLAPHLPHGIGDGALSLRRLAMTFDPPEYSPSRLELEVHSDGPWPLPGLTGFALRDLVLALQVAWPGPEVTGTIGGTVGLAGPALTITASKERGADPWTFAGELVPPPGKTTVALGEFVAALAAKLGALDVPAPLREATLSRAKVKFDTAGGMCFECAGQLPVGGQQLGLALTIKMQRPKDGLHATYGGTVTIARMAFHLAVSTDPSVTRLVGSYTHKPGQPPIEVRKLLAEVWPGPSDPPDIDLKVDLREAVFALAADAAQTRVLFALDLQDIELSALPLVGSALGDAAKVKELRVVAATAAPVGPRAGDAGDVAAWSELLTTAVERGDKPAMPLPAQGIDRGVMVSALLALGETSAPLTLPAAAPSGPPAPAGATASGGPGAPAADGTKWFSVQRSFGPVYLGRVGARYEAGSLWLALDASLSLGGLSLSLNGLSVGSPLSAFDPKPRLDGLGLDFSQGGVEIAGAFLALPGKQLGDASFQYDGAAVVRAASFTLSAIGSYAEVKGHPSLFIFAEFDSPLGGPPAFYVTGLMGGFGYNRALRIPAQDEVHQFPFLQGLDTKLGDGTPLGVLGVLESGDKPWLTEGTGDNWLAVGVTFTSFELVHSRALLVAEFGHELQFALIGLSKLRLPQEESSKAFAYVELELEAVLKPQEGFFGLTARLSPNSFVIAPDCRLTGGFAFYVWFDGKHAGDFVLTLGGYHPAFDLDAYPHYPREPRLGLSWPVNRLVTVAGEAYFALTPSCVMGGGALRVLFHDGNLQAWLTASADFLISWKPFHYRIEVGVSIGVSYRLDLGLVQKTLSVELGARLELWGPPTGGRAHISWYFISFDIAFGAAPPQVPGVEKWSDFEPLLPAGELCKLSCQSGLLAGAAADGDWVVRADALQLASECAIPANKLELDKGTTPDFAKPEQAPAIRPLRVNQLDATQTLHVKDPADHEIDLHETGWTIEARTRHVPAALWGAPLEDPPSEEHPATPPPAADLVSDQWVGFVLSPPGAKAPPTSVGVDMAAALTAVPLEPGGTLPLTETAAPAPGAPAKQAVEAVGGIAAAAPARAAIRSVLGAQRLDPGTDEPLDAYAKATATLFPTAPMLTGKAA